MTNLKINLNDLLNLSETQLVELIIQIFNGSDNEAPLRTVSDILAIRYCSSDGLTFESRKKILNSLEEFSTDKNFITYMLMHNILCENSLPFLSEEMITKCESSDDIPYNLSRVSVLTKGLPKNNKTILKLRKDFIIFLRSHKHLSAIRCLVALMQWDNNSDVKKMLLKARKHLEVYSNCLAVPNLSTDMFLFDQAITIDR